MLEFAVPHGVWRPLWELYVRVGLPAVGRVISPGWHEVGRFLGPSIRDFHARHDLVGLWRAAGIADSQEDGLAYFDDVVGDIGPASSPARRETFLTAGYEMVNFLTRKGVRFVRCPGWSDYYPNHKGGNESGRAIECVPYDAAALGDWRDKVQPSMAKSYGGFVLKTNELRSVQYFNRSPRAFAVAMPELFPWVRPSNKMSHEQLALLTHKAL